MFLFVGSIEIPWKDGYMKRIFALLTFYWGKKTSGVGGGHGPGHDGDDDDDDEDFDDDDDDQCEALSCRVDGYGGEPEAPTPAAPTTIQSLKDKLASLRCQCLSDVLIQVTVSCSKRVNPHKFLWRGFNCRRRKRSNLLLPGP